MIDLEIVAAALRPERFGFVGLIGSSTKRARFLSQMRAAGLAQATLGRLVCPIGVPGLASKDPAVIAASTAAQLLIVGERLTAEEQEGARLRTAAPFMLGRTWCADRAKPARARTGTIMSVLA